MAGLPDTQTRVFAEELALLRRDVNSVQQALRSAQLGQSTLDDGAIGVKDSNGVVRGAIGIASDGSFAVVASNAPPPPAPSKPTCTPIATGVMVRWDGNFAGQPRPKDFSFVEIWHNTANNFSTAILDGNMTDPGEWPVAPLTSGGTHYFWLTAKNTSGKRSPESGVATAIPQMVVAQALLDGIVTELKLANEAVAQNKIKLGAVGQAQIGNQAVSLTNLASGSVDATKLVNGAVTQPAIAANAVTANALAANSVIAGKVAADSVTANELVANSVGASEIVANAVTSDKIVANAVTADKILALAVTADKVAANAINAGHIQAGSITAAKLATTLLLSTTIIAGTSTTGARVVLNSQGIEAYRANGNKTLDFDSATGNMTIIGTYRSAEGGKRIEITTGGDQYMYPSSGSNASMISNQGDGLLMRGPLSSSRAGTVEFDAGNAGLNYGTPGGTQLTGVGVSGNFFGAIAAFSGHRLNGRVAPDGNGRRHFWLHTNSSGNDIGSTLLQYGNNGESTQRPVLHSPTNGCAIAWGAGEIWITNGTLQGFGQISASVFNVNSSVELKDQVKEIEYPDQRSSWDIIEGAPSMEWHYKDEDPANIPDKPMLEGTPLTVRKRNPKYDGKDNEWDALHTNDPERWIEVEQSWPSDMRKIAHRSHRFPIAEDLAAMNAGVINNFTGKTVDQRVDLRDMLGILWDAVDMLIKRNRILEEKLAQRMPLLNLPARPQRGDVVLGVGSIKPGRTKRVLDPLTGQIRDRIKERLEGLGRN